MSLVVPAALLLALGSGATPGKAASGSNASGTNVTSYEVHGVIKSLGTDGASLVVSHDAIPGYMDAMTMPFRVRDSSAMTGLLPGDKISFQLHVTDERSWIDHITRTGSAPVAASAASGSAAAPQHRQQSALLDFKFTDETGRAVSINDFHGQALAITFFFTRCPVPDYCPRLSRNFQEASTRLAAMPGAPTNWHFLSFSFDPDFDTPEVLKAYAARYHYNPARWNFLTGPRDQINELARASGVEVRSDTGLFDHNFRTLIVDAHGHLQSTFPFGGDLSEMIVREMLKAAAVTQESASASPAGAPASAPVVPMSTPIPSQR